MAAPTNFQVTGCKFLKIPLFSIFSIEKAGWSPQCHIPNFVEIGQPFPEKKILEGFYTIYGCGGHLGHVTSIMSSEFHFLVPESFHKKLGSEWHSGF